MQMNDQTKKDFSCNICKLLLEDPVYLPCCCISVCRKHLSDNTAKRGIIDCSFCKKQFDIKAFDFKENKHVKLIMEADAILTRKERHSKAHILDLISKHQELHEKLTLERKVFEVYNYDHFAETRRVIELPREKLKKTIDQMSDVLIVKSKKAEASYQQQCDKLQTKKEFNLKGELRNLKDHFRSIDLTIETINQLKKEQETQIDDIQTKLSQLNQLRERVSLCDFAPNLDFFGGNFGSLRLHVIKKNIVTCSWDITIKM
jgi:uncharacterized coiled-coil protein SlyX